MKLTEIYDEQRGRPLSREEMRDRIINLFHSDNNDVLNHTLQIMSKHLNIDIEELERLLMSDVNKVEHMLMSLDMGDDRDNRRLGRLYKELEHMM